MTSPALPFRDSVRFYDNGAQLVSLLAEQVSGPLREGRDAFVIASAGVVHALSERLHREYSSGATLGVLTLIDAQSTLEQILVEGWPDAAAFERHVGALLRMAGSERPVVVAFGEMISLLWDQGKRDAAIRLEQLWHELEAGGDVTPMCAYPARLFNQVEGEAPYALSLGSRQEATPV